MQGLYIHIPFCTQACHYCDFHFSTNLKSRKEMTSMICRELDLRTGYLEKKELDTLYFGGGTPSLLDLPDLSLIMQKVKSHFTLTNKTEITLEANPDDLSAEKIKGLKELGFNRLSIGIQSFNEVHLKYLNRIHSSEEAEQAVKMAQNEGFENISIDLIYGIPSQTHSIWNEDLQKALTLNVQHISSYCLTIEANTAFGKWVKTNKIHPPDEDFAAVQFEMLMNAMEEKGFEHYEISNFSLPGSHSRHNSNYWLGGHYLGVGPAAHSFNGHTRQFNVSNNALYIKNIREGLIPFEIETLTKTDKINEHLLTGIRTHWGCDLTKLQKYYELDISAYETLIESYESGGYLTYESGILKLTKKGMLIADKITSDFFMA